MTNDLSAKAYKFTGFDGNTATYEETGVCETWNCSRGAWRTLMNLRVSYNLRLVGSSRVELIGEVFNLFNAKNPAGFNTAQFGATGTPNAGVHAADRRSPATSRRANSASGSSGSGSRSSWQFAVNG